VFAPLRGFTDAANVAVVAEHGTLADGTLWPLTVTERRPVPGPGDVANRSALPSHVRLVGPMTSLREPVHGPVRQLRRHPEAVRGRDGGAADAACPWRSGEFMEPFHPPSAQLNSKGKDLSPGRQDESNPRTPNL
jgi:sulfate adenylyltransferase